MLAEPVECKPWTSLHTPFGVQRQLHVDQPCVVRRDGFIELLDKTLRELAPHLVEGRRNFWPRNARDASSYLLAPRHRTAQRLGQILRVDHQQIIIDGERAPRLGPRFLLRRAGERAEVKVLGTAVPRRPSERDVPRRLLVEQVGLHCGAPRFPRRLLRERFGLARRHLRSPSLILRRSGNPRLIFLEDTT